MMNYYTLSNTRRCPYCGSTDLIIDYERGQLICRSCGAVIDETVVDSTSMAVSRPSLTRPRRSSIVEDNSAREMLRGLLARDKAVKLLGSTRQGMLYVARVNTSELTELLSNECLRAILDKLSPSERMAVIEAARHLALGEDPLPSMLEREFGVPRRKLRAILLGVRNCLGIPRHVDML